MSAAHGTGNWLGAASALIRGGYIYLAYRERHATAKGRGNRVYLARSPIDDGVDFDTFWAIGKADMDAASLERPALDVTPDGDWFLYLSCAAHNSKHWRIDRLHAGDPHDFNARTRHTIFPGSPAFGIKDPVIIRDGNNLRIWATRHPLTQGDENADQMTSVVACTGEPVMTPEPGTWYSRGTRITAIVNQYAYFDGRASASQNFAERTGIARWNGSRYIPIAGPASSSLGDGALRYVSAIMIPDGRLRLYYEAPPRTGVMNCVPNCALTRIAHSALFNLADCARSVRDFPWEGARAEFDGLPGGGGLNIAAIMLAGPAPNLEGMPASGRPPRGFGPKGPPGRDAGLKR